MEGLWSGRQGFMIPEGEVILRHLSQTLGYLTEPRAALEQPTLVLAV